MKTKENNPKKNLESTDFSDIRLNKRLKKTMEDFTKNAQKSILGAEENRRSAKAFYRLLSNEKFEIEKLADVVKAATIRRREGTVLLIEDTIDINLNYRLLKRAGQRINTHRRKARYKAQAF